MMNNPLYNQIEGYLAEDTPSETPLYVRLAGAFERLVDDGFIHEGEAIPSERKLADQLGIARGTVRQAIEQLVETGRLTRRHGARTMVSKRIEKSLSNLVGFSDDMRARGIEPGAILISCERKKPNSEETRALKLPPGAEVLRLSRIRTADGVPIAIERATLPSDIIADFDAQTESLYEELAKIGAEPVHGFQRIRAGVANDFESEQLGCEVGAPLLIIERLCEGRSGHPVELTETRYNGEAYDFLTELVK